MLQSLGLDTLSEGAAEELHLNYAAQLEQEGLWHWAVFVLLHLSDPLRCVCVCVCVCVFVCVCACVCLCVHVCVVYLFMCISTLYNVNTMCRC